MSGSYGEGKGACVNVCILLLIALRDICQNLNVATSLLMIFVMADLIN